MILENYIFQNAELLFDEKVSSNLFSLKNNKTLLQTLEQKKYSKFKNNFTSKYLDYLDQPLGKFLLKLKEIKDYNYKYFLNKYGDGSYCKFKIVDKNVLVKKGVYYFKYKDEIKYIGRCKDSFYKRINAGYGNISPKNCFIDGQATNCHMNELILNHKDFISFWFLEMKNDLDICALEIDLIKKLKPEWNIALAK